MKKYLTRPIRRS